MTCSTYKTILKLPNIHFEKEKSFYFTPSLSKAIDAWYVETHQFKKTDHSLTFTFTLASLGQVLLDVSDCGVGQPHLRRLRSLWSLEYHKASHAWIACILKARYVGAIVSSAYR